MSKSKLSFSHLDRYKKDFADLFIKLSERHGRHEVWSGFITMTACSISNSCDRQFFDEREKLYLSIAKKYTKDELEMFAQMFAIVVLALEDNPEQDFLGSLFSALNLHNEWKGQFFTPYHIGQFMAAINLVDADKQLQQRDIITVNDCCCGAGCLLIAFANEARKASIDFQRRVIFVAQDIDYTAALMCYIQLSLLGCKAVVKIGNSLTDPFVAQEPKSEKLWFTPMYLYGDVFRIMSILESIELNKEVTPNGEEEKDNRENKSA